MHISFPFMQMKRLRRLGNKYTSILYPLLHSIGTERKEGRRNGGTDEEASKQQGVEWWSDGAGRMRGEGGRKEGGEGSKDSSVCLIVPAG